MFKRLTVFVLNFIHQSQLFECHILRSSSKSTIRIKKQIVLSDNINGFCDQLIDINLIINNVYG